MEIDSVSLFSPRMALDRHDFAIAAAGIHLVSYHDKPLQSLEGNSKLTA